MLQAASGSVPSTADETSKIDDKSETYSHDMTAAMGAGMFNILYIVVVS